MSFPNIYVVYAPTSTQTSHKYSIHPPLSCSVLSSATNANPSLSEGIHDENDGPRRPGPTAAGSRDTKSWPRISRHPPPAVLARFRMHLPLSRLHLSPASIQDPTPTSCTPPFLTNFAIFVPMNCPPVRSPRRGSALPASTLASCSGIKCVPLL